MLSRASITVSAAAGIFAVSVAPPAWATSLPIFDEMQKYLIIGTDNNSNNTTVQVSNGELGADRHVLSDGSTVEVAPGTSGPNTKSVFFQDGARWRTASSPATGADPVQAAPIFEGVDWTGNIAVTNPGGQFNLSSVSVFADIGIDCASSSVSGCRAGASNSSYFPDQSTIGAAIAGGAGINLFNPAPLLSELDGFNDFINSLAVEQTITSDIVKQNRKDGSGPLVTLVDAVDANNDGIAVFDINVGDTDFNLEDSDWILDGDGLTMSIFRIIGNSKFDIKNSSILLGSGYNETFMDFATNDKRPLGAIFVHNDARNDFTGEVINADNIVLNGVGLWDLNAFKGSTFDMSRDTRVNIQNGQGCAQFIGAEVHMSNVRFNGCTTPIPLPLPAFLLFGGLGALGAVRYLGRGVA